MGRRRKIHDTKRKEKREKGKTMEGGFRVWLERFFGRKE